MSRAGFAALRRWFSIQMTRLSIMRFQRLHPGKTFAEFYAWQIGEKLDREVAHKQLGKRRFDPRRPLARAPEHDPETFAARKPSIVQELAVLGLRPHHTLVDFGCGSLRLGQHFIRHLEPGSYWGLDVGDRFFSDGLEMIGPRVVREKMPRCRIICADSLKEAAGAKPDFVLSTSVLKHVPRSELPTYFDRITGLMCPETRLVIDYREAEQELRTAGKAWAYPRDLVTGLLEARCPGRRIEVVELHKGRSPGNGEPDHRFVLVGSA